MEWERYRLATKQPHELLDFKRDVDNAQLWLADLAESLKQYSDKHESARAHGRHSSAVIAGGDVEPAEACNVIGHDLAESDLGVPEWKAFHEMARTTAKRTAQAGLILELVCNIDGVAEAIEESGILSIDGDSAESQALEIWRRLVARVRSQQPNGPSDAKRLLRDTAGLLDPSTETAFHVSHSGYVTYTQTKTSARPESRAA